MRSLLAYIQNRPILWNTGSQFFGKIITATITFFISLSIVRFYGLHVYGDYTKVLSFVGFFYLLVDFGLNAIYLQDVQSYAHLLPRQIHPWQRLLSHRIVLGVACAIIGGLFLMFIPNGNADGYSASVKLGILCYLITLIFHGMLVSANAMFQQYLRYDYAARALTIGSIFHIACILLVVSQFVAEASLLPLVIASLCAYGLTSSVSIYFARGLLRRARDRFALLPLSYFFRAFPLGLTMLFNIVYFRLDTVVLTFFRSTEEVGVYGLAFRIFEFALTIPTFYMNAVYPSLTRAVEENRIDMFIHLLQRSIRRLLIGSVIVGLAIGFSAPLIQIIDMDLIHVVRPLRILLLGLPAFYVSSVIMWALIAWRQQRLLPVVYGSAMIGIIACNIYFIPRYGVLAAAWTTVIFEVFLVVGTTFLLISKLPRANL